MSKYSINEDDSQFGDTESNMSDINNSDVLDTVSTQKDKKKSQFRVDVSSKLTKDGDESSLDLDLPTPLEETKL